MHSISALWHPAMRKEVFDLLVHLWPALDEDGRVKLSVSLLKGPPEEVLACAQDVDARTLRSDRSIFERIALLDRIEGTGLTDSLRAELTRIDAIYPGWEIADGSKAHFSTWMETGWRGAAQVGEEDVKALDIEAWLSLMQSDRWELDSHFAAWSALARRDPAFVLSFLKEVSEDPRPMPQLWAHALQGIRENAKTPEGLATLIDMIAAMNDATLNDPGVSRAAADAIEAATTREGAVLSEDFWSAYSRSLRAASIDPDNADSPGHNGWVSLAINRSMGSLATALLNALFELRLKVGSGIPPVFVARFDALLGKGVRGHLPARVIAASRLSYLYAVDSDWTTQNLLPNFDWADETEALAAWEGYFWQPRIDLQLWEALASSFFDAFQPERLAQFEGDARRVFAQFLPLVGIEFSMAHSHAPSVRSAVRALPPADRRELVRWIKNYLKNQAQESAPGDLSPSVDRSWSDQVAPWLKSVWPPERQFQTPGASAQFAAIAILTKGVFSQAVDLVSAFMVPACGGSALTMLGESNHPDIHPEASLKLISHLLSLDETHTELDTLRNCLQRIHAAEPDLAGRKAFRDWNEYLRVRQT